ncbi:MAG: 23S rRNA (adenine(2503)-C(2))-methyltransferase RlmN [Candidatus Dadabacteria bacterium]|nr:23S rRNA (adenine(2503)-C(2))-methyltransferase RlmN [Candidatus Dadabacteria bacterium]NIQ14650.1 23S rRNA (adenine(2503)-C(2))-methyltransferase RlmN [Candidatus Dadabacteria bacterium]
MLQKNIRDFSPSQLDEFIESSGEKSYRSKQIAQWLYKKGVKSYKEMSNLPVDFRERLQNDIEINDSISLLEEKVSIDGTKKYLFSLSDGNKIESVLIPDKKRKTLCVSSQVGCALGCKFCLTATLNKIRNLKTSEIIDQYLIVNSLNSNGITNIVFMGMGEPLDNLDNLINSIEILTDENFIGLSKKRITVSTSGLVPKIKELGERLTVNLSISLNAPNDEIRNEIMPINRRYPIKTLIDSIKSFPLPNRKLITFEYVLIKDINDSELHAQQLGQLLKNIRCKVNLIPLNEADPIKYKTPKTEDVYNFQDILINYGLNVKIRKNRGRDILSACGQLAADYSSNKITH